MCFPSIQFIAVLSFGMRKRKSIRKVVCIMNHDYESHCCLSSRDSNQTVIILSLHKRKANEENFEYDKFTANRFLGAKGEIRKISKMISTETANGTLEIKSMIFIFHYVLFTPFPICMHSSI